MKPFIYTIALWAVLSVLSPALPLAEDEPDYKRFTDIVYEWTAGGDMIQIGDYTISKIKSVWLDKGDRDELGNAILIRTGKNKIRVGDLATPLMLEQDNSGYWIAEKLIVYSGNGVKEALKRIPAAVKEAYLSNRN